MVNKARVRDVLGSSFRLTLTLILFAAVSAAIACVIAVFHLAQPYPSNSHSHSRSAVSAKISGVPPSAGRPPPVEPLKLLPLTADSARAANATVPFVAGKIMPAKSFVFSGSPSDRENATTCLAAAVLYEAGDDKAGEQAVAQVVLNRVRHPAFPNTVCGVIFEGSERNTGCQFTFACDGSLARRPQPEVWSRARAIADAAIGGSVDREVGLTTHYHTDWVVPYWSASLDKIARVHTQLFFGWRGWWGSSAAFINTYAGGEQLDPRIASLSRAIPDVTKPADIADVGLPTTAPILTPAAPSISVDGVSKADLRGAQIRLADAKAGVFVLQLDPATFPGSYALSALGICRNRPVCTVVGFIHPEFIPPALPLTESDIEKSSIRYYSIKDQKVDMLMWNCRQIKRNQMDNCYPKALAD